MISFHSSTIHRYNDDGTHLVTEYGDYGMIFAETMYTADDSVSYATTYTYEFDESDNVTHSRTFNNGVLFHDDQYAFDENRADAQKMHQPE